MSPKYKIGVFGSSAGDLSVTLPKAVAIGEVLGDHADSTILITGACPGLPYAAAKVAAHKGVEVWGFASALDEALHRQKYPDDDPTIYKKLIYVPADFPFANSDRARKKYRNVISTATCDAGIVISGRWGSLNEFTNLLDMQKVVGVLTDTRGIADELPALSKKISKAGQGEIIFDDNPKVLVEKIFRALEKL
jgi:predicted Rossmann-fold nucleotide-binding protein